LLAQNGTDRATVTQAVGAAAAPDDQATQEKKAFAALWTAIAGEYGLPLYQYNQI